MIAQLRGRLAAVALGHVIVDVEGVGYRVHVPPGSMNARAGEEVTLHTHLAVREDALTLYGFADASARDLYEIVLGVSGFGPKLALAAIGALGAAGLRGAVLTEDVAALTAIPGVGRKSAQRMILELGSKLGADPDIDLTAGAAPDALVEVREALSALGYGSAEVRSALNAVDLPEEQRREPEALLRAALRHLGGAGAGAGVTAAGSAQGDAGGRG